MVPSAILCLTTDQDTVTALDRATARLGTESQVAASLPEAAWLLKQRPFDAVLVQVDCPACGLPIQVKDILKRDGNPPVFALSRKNSIREAVLAVRAGAADYVPLSDDDDSTLQNLLAQVSSRRTSAQSVLSPHSDRSERLNGFVTADHRTIEACDMLLHLAACDAVALLTGEPGTGKSMLARLLHENSKETPTAPFVVVNASAHSREEIERVLVGSATGRGVAGAAPPEGKFRLAKGGTLLVKGLGSVTDVVCDVIGRSASRSATALGVDVRVIIAACMDNCSRTELCGRPLVRVHVPALRERIIDVPLLARHFCRQFAARHNRPARDVGPDALSALVRYSWPGNVREMENALEAAVIVAEADALHLADLPDSVTAAACDELTVLPVAMPGSSLKDALRGPERRHILRALRQTDWNKHSAARKLQISRSTLYKKIQEYGLAR